MKVNKIKAAAKAAATCASAAAIVVIFATSEARTAYRHTLDIHFQDLLADQAYDLWIRENLTCRRSTFLALVDLLRTKFVKIDMEKYSKKHPFSTKVAMMLYFFASQGGYRETANTFGASRSWVHEIVNAFITALVGITNQYIRLPSTQRKWQQIENGFFDKRGFPGVVGAIDGTLFQIPRPREHEGFYCRHFYTALNVQAVVDDKGKFMSIDVRPGSWSDKKTWRLSWLGRIAKYVLPPGRHLLGDAGYTLLPWLMTPYVQRECGGYLTRKQRHYNYVLSATRMTVESAFGRLKGRFRSLLVSLNHKSSTKQAQHIASCIVLHNMLVDLADDMPVAEAQLEDNQFEEITEDNPFHREIAITKRHSIVSLLYGEI